MQCLERAVKIMIRWMCDATLQDRELSEELRQRLSITCIQCV